ncbi:MAG: hypothetical protein HZA53_11190 [Planctomycetes bacterium]|nr:hypothetical protein [Planctomycetota bacterium]
MLLVVNGGPALDRTIRDALDECWPGVELVHAPDDDAAMAVGGADAICVHLDPPFGRALALLRRIRETARSTPIVALGARCDDAHVELALRSGACAWIDADAITSEELARALGQTLAAAPMPVRAERNGPCVGWFAVDEAERALHAAAERRARAMEPAEGPRFGGTDPESSDGNVEPSEGVPERPTANAADAPRAIEHARAASDPIDGEGACVETPPSTPSTAVEQPVLDDPGVERVKAPSSVSDAALEQPALDDPGAPSAEPLELRLARGRRLALIPIQKDGLPDVDRIARVRALDVAAGTLRMALADWSSIAGGHAIAVAELGDARNEFAWIEHDLRASAELGTFVARVRGSLEDLLDAARLEPVLDVNTMRFRYGHADALIEAWCALGVLVPALVDRVVVCPRCAALPTLRLGCRRCGSARLSSEREIHHFACANVARASEYETSHDLACPKCRARELVVNADYEYLSGPWDCADCGFQCGERDPVGHCIACGERFFTRDAHELELVSFHAARMEPLALLAAP